MITKPSELLAAETKLVELYRALKAKCEGWDQPFLAGYGAEYGKNGPKILFIGKATGGWDDVPNPEDTVSIHQTSKDFLNEVAPQPRSAFWHYIDALAGRLATEEGCEWENPLQHVAWSNLAKIGVNRGNPEGSDFAVQADICEELLRLEIEWLAPDLVVILTHNYQWKFVKSTFEGYDWADLPNCGHQSAWIGVSGSGPLAVWTRHPQGKSSNSRQSEQEAIVNWYRSNRYRK